MVYIRLSSYVSYIVGPVPWSKQALKGGQNYEV